jgi:hypothetical protein
VKEHNGDDAFLLRERRQVGREEREEEKPDGLHEEDTLTCCDFFGVCPWEFPRESDMAVSLFQSEFLYKGSEFSRWVCS